MQVAPFLAYLAAAALFIYGIRRLRTPETARSGNTLAAIGMVAVIFGAMNVVGGFWVTNRMLGMFGPPKKRVRKREE